jgi:hypothetical protein
VKSLFLILTVCAVVVIFGTLCTPLAAGDDTAVSAAGPCCFENPRYSGTCQVTPGEDESCGDVLSYLNNPNSVGKDYCGNTTIRGGWTQVACEDSAGTAVCTAGAESSAKQ